MRNCFTCNDAINEDCFAVLDEQFPQYVMCDECYRMLSRLPKCTDEELYNKIDARFSSVARSTAVPQSIKKIFRKADDDYWQFKESLSKYNEAHETALENLMLTTGSSFDGYKVVKYLDIISCEVVFKNSFINSLSAGFEDFLKGLSFKEKELSGATELIERGKQYVMTKFREKAISMCANAVLGIDFETSFGSEIVKISVNGTAVIVDKIET